MASEIKVSYESFNGGISDFDSESGGIPNSYAFGRSVDTRSNPRTLSILPRTVKESGTVIQDLPLWAESYSTDIYFYGNVGKIYKRTSTPVYSLLRTVSNSHGNGLVYSAEDNFLYYTQDKAIGRYGPLNSASPTFTDDFLGAQGGVPLNTNSLDLESSSSQYASRADTTSLSITGNIAIEAQIKPESLPTVGNTMVFASKWDESGTTRSYKFDMAAVSGYFGDGSDSSLTISADTTEAPIDSAATATSGSTSISATNASFTAGQQIFLHQTQGTGVGTWQRLTIQGYTAGTITTIETITANYVTGAQVRVLKQYTDVTINSGKTYTAKAWNGTVGGILAFLASGTVTVTGNITASGKGFRGGAGASSANTYGVQGESVSGTGTAITSANSSAGGGGAGFANQGGGGGGGAGHSTVGTAGSYGENPPLIGGDAGTTSADTADLTTMIFGSGGGGGGVGDGVITPGDGGAGGGIVFITGATLVVSGSVTANGANGLNTAGDQGPGGGGAGGSTLLKSQIATLGSNLTVASGGTGGSGNMFGPFHTTMGGNGGDGRIHLDYYTSYTGSTTPTLDFAQDSNLVTTTTYRLRLLLSSTGLNSEILQKDVNVITSVWQDVGVSWVASTHIATFYLNAVSLGTITGTLGAIHDNTSRFAVGASYNGAGSAANFYDGLIDEVRLFNMPRSATDFLLGLNTQIATNTPGLVAYYKFNGDYSDSTTNTNTLTATNSPVFSSDVPYPSPTTRLDIDQQDTTVGHTYTVPVAISEATVDQKTFTPARDPQKSIAVLVAAVGSGNWTLTVHDQYNNVVAQKTVSNGMMTTGYYEFIFSSVWRPLTGFTQEYHFHLTSTVADGTVTTGTDDDLETVSYRTYYQFLVEDVAWHPGARFLNFLVFGNERYVAVYDAPLYEPNQIVLQAGLRVRCFALWREYLAIGVMRGNDLSGSGRIYFWDGAAPTFNTFIEVPQGGINTMLSDRGKLYVWAGPQAQQLVYQGGDSADKLKDIPLLENTATAEIYPQGVCMWDSLVRYGLAGSSTSMNIQRGVYTYGSVNLRYPDSLTYDYPISTGTLSSTTLNMGVTVVTGSKLLIGWQDNISYGVDNVSASNDPFPTATIEFFIENNGATWKEKQTVEMIANFNALNVGEIINTKYKEDDDTNWTTNQNIPNTGEVVTRQLTGSGRYHQIQMAIDLSTSGSTTPYLNSGLIVANANSSEERNG